MAPCAARHGSGHGLGLLCIGVFYAAEGVLPGPFDDGLFRRVWAVKQRALATVP